MMWRKAAGRQGKLGRTAVVLAVLLFLLSFGILPQAVQAAKEDGGSAGDGAEGEAALRVAFPEVKGITEWDENGEPVGMVVDFLNEISKYTGWEYEYVDTAAEEMISEFIDGKFDLMGGTFYSESLESIFAYPKYNMGNSKAVLLCRNDDSDLKSYDLQSLNGKRIGVYERAEEKIRRLKEFLSMNDLKCELVYYGYEMLDDTGTLYSYLESGEVDMLLGNDTEKEPEFRVLTAFGAQAYYIVTVPGNQEILDGLNMAMEHILDANPDYPEKLYSAYFQNVNDFRLRVSQEEQAYLDGKETLKVAVVENWHPFYCLGNEADYHDGLIPDLFERIKEATGLNYEMVIAKTYSEAIDLVREGKADVLGAFLGSESDAKNMGLALTQNYVSLNNIIVKNKWVDYPGEDLTGTVVEGRKMPSDIEVGEIQYSAGLEEGIRAVDRGSADFVYGLAAYLEHEIQEHHYANVVPVSMINQNEPISIAFVRPVEPELLTLLNKVIESIPEEEKKTLLDRNMVLLGTSTMNLSDFVYAEPVAFVLICAVILMFFVTTLLLIVRARVKSSLLAGELKKAEAENRAKSEFLSRMSHEIRTPMNAISGLSELTCMMGEVPAAVAKNLRKIRSSSQYLLSLINDILDMSRIENGMLGVTEEDFSISVMIEELKDMMWAQAEQKQVHFQMETQVRHEWIRGDELRLRQVLVNLLSNAIKFTPAGGSVLLKVEEKEHGEGKAGYFFSVRDDGTGIADGDQERIFGVFEQVGNNISKSEGTGLGLPISRNIIRLMGGELKLLSLSGEGSEFYFTLDFPLAKEQEGAQKTERDSDGDELHGLRILLVEDNELNAEIAIELLKMKGMEVEWAANGQAAAELFEKSDAGYYKLVLMDIQMPVMNGLDSARRIRSCRHPDAAGIPIVAMTANSFKEDTEAAAAAGMNGFLAKPVDAQNLYGTIRNCCCET